MSKPSIDDVINRMMVPEMKVWDIKPDHEASMIRMTNGCSALHIYVDDRSLYPDLDFNSGLFQTINALIDNDVVISSGLHFGHTGGHYSGMRHRLGGNINGRKGRAKLEIYYIPEYIQVRIRTKIRGRDKISLPWTTVHNGGEVLRLLDQEIVHAEQAEKTIPAKLFDTPEYGTERTNWRGHDMTMRIRHNSIHKAGVIGIASMGVAGTFELMPGNPKHDDVWFLIRVERYNTFDRVGGCTVTIAFNNDRWIEVSGITHFVVTNTQMSLNQCDREFLSETVKDYLATCL